MNPEPRIRSRPGRPAGALWACALLLVPALGCDRSVTTQVADPSLTAVQATFVNYDMRSYLTAQGVRTGTLSADTAYIFADSSVALMYGVEMSVHDNGLEQARVVADSGRLNQRTEQMVAWGTVVVDLPQRGCRIYGTEMHYDPPRQEIRSDRPARFEQGGRVTTVTGFTSDLRFQTFRFRGMVGPTRICDPGMGRP